MKKRRISRLAQRRAPIISLAVLLGTVALLSLALLASAQQPPVEVGKTADPDTVRPNESTTYTVLFTNTTGSPVDIEEVSDTLPAGFTFQAMGTPPAGEDCICDNPTGTTGTIVWDNGPYTVEADDVLYLVYHVLVNAEASSTAYLNQVEALLDTAETVSASAEVYVGGPDLDGSKTASKAEVPYDETVDYTVSLHNGGTTAAHVSEIRDTLPATFAFDQMLSGPLPAPTIQGNELVWTDATEIPAGNTLQFSYRVIVGGTVGQTYANAVEADYDGLTAGPYAASVTVLERDFFAYLPIITQIEPPPPEEVYRLAYGSRPDGDTPYEIYTVDADGTDRINVSNEPYADLDPKWSPDGTKIAWVNFAGEIGDIFVANGDGSGKTNLTNYAMADRGPNWSPDGSKIAFYRRISEGGTDRWEVYVMDANGANVTRLTDEMCQSHDPVWSPDGSKIAFICGLDAYAEVYVMNANGSNVVRLTQDDTSLYREDASLNWSPDSTRLAYGKYHNRKWKELQGIGDIYVVNVSTGAITRLTTDNDPPSLSPAWSPDGTKIAFAKIVDGNYEVVTVNPDGSNLINVTKKAKGDFGPKWSPDGLKISFTSNRDGNMELYVMDAAGTNQFRLTTTSTNESGHDWKPQ